MFNTECADHGGRGLWFFRRQGDNFRRMSGRNRRVERPVASTDDAFHPGKQAAGSRRVDVNEGASRIAERAFKGRIDVATWTHLAQIVYTLIRLIVGSDRNQSVRENDR